jgi:hypothetical protein
MFSFDENDKVAQTIHICHSKFAHFLQYTQVLSIKEQTIKIKSPCFQIISPYAQVSYLCWKLLSVFYMQESKNLDEISSINCFHWWMVCQKFSLRTLIVYSLLYSVCSKSDLWVWLGYYHCAFGFYLHHLSALVFFSASTFVKQKRLIAIIDEFPKFLQNICFVEFSFNIFFFNNQIETSFYCLASWKLCMLLTFSENGPTSNFWKWFPA